MSILRDYNDYLVNFFWPLFFIDLNASKMIPKVCVKEHFQIDQNNRFF